MPTTDDLRASAAAGDDGVHVGHVILIDGLQTGFTDTAGLVGASTGASHSIVLGLSREDLSYRLAIDLRTGQFLDSPLSFTLRNVTGTLDLADLFKAIDDTERALDDVPVGSGLPIHPATSLTARTDLHSRNVGLERIGAAGERHLYPVPPDYAIGGEHRLRSAQNNLEAAPVSDDPIVWNGRRVVLYRVYRDHVTYPGQPTQGWRPFAEWRRIWWGTLRDDGVVAGHEWEVEADGPESLLRKPLGIEFQREPVPALAFYDLSADESAVGIRLQSPGAGAGFEDWGTADFTYTITATTPDGIIAEVRGFIDDIASTVGGPDGVYNDQAGCSVSMDDQGVVRISIVSTASAGVQLTLGMHAKVWAIHGYVPDWQNALVPDFSDSRAVDFIDQNDPFDQFVAGAPGPGYVFGYFYSGSILDPSPPTDTDPLGVTNDGNPRVFHPWYLSGTQVLFADPTQKGTRAGQLVRIGDAALGVDTSSSTVAHPGQLDMPPASAIENVQAAYTLNGLPVNRQGLWLFFGKRRLEDPNGSGAVVDEYQVARASWVNASGQQDGLVNGDTILITEWLDPGLFGFNRPKLGNDSENENDHQWAGDWVSRVDAINSEDGLLFCVPIVGLGYMKASTDLAHIVLQRLLLTTGTSQGWSSFAADEAATQDPGDNEPSPTSSVAVLDAEGATLGLGIPSDWVQPASSFSAAADRVDVQAILQQKVAFSGGYQSLDVIRGLMQPIGWCWNLRGGQYGVWCPADPIGLADAELVVVKVAKPTEGGARTTRQQQRKAQPIDRFTFDAGWAPHLNRTKDKIELQSPDPGYAYRPGDVPMTVPAHSYRGKGGLSERVAHIAAFWARRHFEVKGYRVPMIPFEDCWPGTIVRITDAELVDPRGTVGITNRLAIVTAVNVEMGLDEGVTKLDLLVLADRTITPRLNAPVAVGYRWDSATSTAYVHDNYFGFEDPDWSDAAAFLEPSYTDIDPIGGNAVVAGYQWDGDSLQLRITGTVSAVSTTPGAASLRLTGTSGTAYRDMDTLWVLRSKATANNGAWVEALHAPICDDDGTFTTTIGSSAGYPWEV